MRKFDALFNVIIENLGNTASGAFGSATTGNYGNQFPSNNDLAYNPGNALPAAPTDLALGKRVKSKKKDKERKKTKTVSFPIQRRVLSAKQ
jgi:hypothetical protein